MRPNKGSNVALVALISLVVGASYHRLWRLAKQPTTTQWVTHARAKARPAPQTFGRPTAGDPRGRSGRAPLHSQGPRRRIKELGAWETVSSASRPYEFCESSKATYKDLIYVVGGFLCDFNRVTDRVQMLNASSGAWTTVARLPASAAKHQTQSVCPSSAASRVVFSLCWRLGGLSDAACLASVQQRCRGDVRLPSEVLAALESAVTDGDVDARRDSTAICEILRSCQQTGPGGAGLLPSAEEGIPGREGASSSSDRAAAAMDLFRALLDRCPDREDYLRCLLEPTVVPIEALELVSARASAIPEPLWIAVILPFVEQLLSGASRGRDGALEQESILLLRECVTAFYQGQSQGVQASVALGQTLFRGLLSAMQSGAEERRTCADCAATVCATHLAHGSLGWLAEMLAGGPTVGGGSGWVPAAPAAPDPAVPQPGALYPAPAPEPEPAYAPPAAPPGGTAVAAARWNASVSATPRFTPWP